MDNLTRLLLLGLQSDGGASEGGGEEPVPDGTIAFEASDTSSASSTTHTFADFDIGPYSANRVLVIGVGTADADDGTTPVTFTMTVGGASATKQGNEARHSADTFEAVAGVFYIDAGEGSALEDLTTADIVVTASESIDVCIVSLASLTGVDTPPTDAGTATGDPLSDTLTVTDGGVAFGFAVHLDLVFGTITAAWTGLTEADSGGDGLGTVYSAATAAFETGGDIAVSNNWSDTPSNSAGVFISFGPPA